MKIAGTNTNVVRPTLTVTRRNDNSLWDLAINPLRNPEPRNRSAIGIVALTETTPPPSSNVVIMEILSMTTKYGSVFPATIVN